MNEGSAAQDEIDSIPQQPMDRLYISAPQGPVRLPGPPTFGHRPIVSKPRGCKHVHFQGAEVVSFIEAGSDMTPEERRQLWYSTEDLDGYKTEARSMSRKLRGPEEPENDAPHSEEVECSASTIQYQKPTPQSPSACPSVDSGPLTSEEEEDRKPAAVSKDCPTTSSEEESQEGDTRGLEHRVCLNRQRHKYLAIRCTLKAQMQSRCPDFIARISNKCTSWAKEIAVAEANRDYCEAYCPQELTSPKKLTNDCPLMNFLFRRPSKRCHEGQQVEPHCPAPASQEVEQNVAEVPPGECESAPKPQKAMCWMERCVRQKCNKDC